MTKGYVYKISSTLTDQVYIGSTMFTLYKAVDRHFRKVKGDCIAQKILRLGCVTIECLEEVEIDGEPLIDGVNILKRREIEHNRLYLCQLEEQKKSGLPLVPPTNNVRHYEGKTWIAEPTYPTELEEWIYNTKPYIHKTLIEFEHYSKFKEEQHLIWEKLLYNVSQ